jgi:protein-S-isoprenylcysteine O-methyltransferase Ste14
VSYFIAGMFALAAATWIATSFVAAPYGRYERAGWGPTLPSRLGWMVMESPAVIAFAAFYSTGEHPRDLGSLALLALWMSHYLERAFIFPLTLREKGKRMPLAVVALAITFNTYNAFINARWIASTGHYGSAWLLEPRFLAGAAIFAVGYGMNRWADDVLRRLRAPGETGYKIPRGGLYELVTCPNYLGEVVIWCGWAVASWSAAGVAFAAYTVANLAPRARSHQTWYRATFPDFPKARRAMIPWLF